MIAWLRGLVVSKGSDTVVLDVGGVGYELFASVRTLDAVPAAGAPVTLHVTTIVREDAITLYGFHDAASKRVFGALMTVSGIGPKLALSALGTFAIDELRQAIVSGDHKKLGRISGVGPKMAQRIALELSQRLRGVDTDGLELSVPARAPSHLDDLRAALAGLGYAPKVVDSAADQLAGRAKAGATTEDLLKEALALLRS